MKDLIRIFSLLVSFPLSIFFAICFGFVGEWLASGACAVLAAYLYFSA